MVIAPQANPERRGQSQPSGACEVLAGKQWRAPTSLVRQRKSAHANHTKIFGLLRSRMWQARILTTSPPTAPNRNKRGIRLVRSPKRALA